MLSDIFPGEQQSLWKAYFMEYPIEEIRLRIHQPIRFRCLGKEYCMKDSNAQERRCSREELEQVVNHICRCSPYAYQGQLRQGFITIKGGHRIGMSGELLSNSRQEPITMKTVSALNIRIAREHKGVGGPVLPYLIERQRLQNTLIIAPPGCGKTTLLRDLIRLLSTGSDMLPGQNVGVVDERSEIAACYEGIPQLDLGPRTDVLDKCPKCIGMMHMVRSMAPDIIAVDEIGGAEEYQELRRIMQCGVGILATIHGEVWADLIGDRFQSSYIPGPLFQRYVFLERSNGQFRVNKISTGKEYLDEMARLYIDYNGKHLLGTGSKTKESCCS